MERGMEVSDCVSECIRPAAFAPNQNYHLTAPTRNYKLYNHRLASYTHWRYSHIISPETLARGGFFYKAETYESSLIEEDTVQCGFCGLRLKRWEIVDNPMHEHYKRNKRCPLIQYLCPV